MLPQLRICLASTSVLLLHLEPVPALGNEWQGRILVQAARKQVVSVRGLGRQVQALGSEVRQ